jgi:hypothetical protein
VLESLQQYVSLIKKILRNHVLARELFALPDSVARQLFAGITGFDVSFSVSEQVLISPSP